MDLGLDGRVAIVAAASRGLGFAAAERLAAEGARVALCSRDADAVQAAAAAIIERTGSEVFGVVADLTSTDAVNAFVARAVERFGAAHIVVANCGGPPSGSFDDFDDEQAYRDALDLSFLSAWRVIHAAVPHLRAAGWGRIVTITSAAVRQPIDNLILSNIARPAVVGLVRSLANELAAEGITVNNIAPGWIETDRVRTLVDTRATASSTTIEDAAAGIIGRIPLGRMGNPEELGALVGYLCSAHAGYLTGQTITLDGGMSRNLL